MAGIITTMVQTMHMMKEWGTRMDNDKDGGQAFPHGNPEQGGDIGMTLRDYFAGQALAGATSNPLWDSTDWEDIATLSYDAADAMLGARNK